MSHARFASSLVTAGLLGASLLIASGARAEKPSSTVVLPDLEITGRVNKPLVTVEMQRVAPTIPLSQLRPPFAEKIAVATQRQPF